MRPPVSAASARPRKGLAPVRGGRLFYREIGRGLPTIVLHGGPDFDHRYLLPEMDRLSDRLRLVYYDQRGRGSSMPDTDPDSVTIAGESEDLDGLRAHLGLDTTALLGHSWGALLALEYAVRHPQRVSHLILMNGAAASAAECARFRDGRRRRAPADLEHLRALAAAPRFVSGDLEADAEYYRVHFRTALARREDVERIVIRLRAGFTPAGVVRARAIERRLYAETWSAEGYDLLPSLARLRIPTLVIHGDHDLIPRSCAEHVARAIPDARLRVLRDCGHFAYLERPEEVHQAVGAFLAGTARV
jgi:proline iminopeptidase